MDKLVKVWLKDGEERWLLIHIEVQASKEGDFPRRMHVYNHRLFDRYGREVISLAILADDDPAWRPNRYEYGRWGFRTSTEFPIVKLLDYAPKYQELESDPNPFAVVVLAHLKALETRRSPAERHAWKVRLVKGLYERGMDPEDVRQLFRFIDWVMGLPEPLEELFWDEIDAYQQENVMPFIDIAERMGLEKGLLEGIEVALDVKFGAEGLELMPELREIRDHVLLRKVAGEDQDGEQPRRAAPRLDPQAPAEAGEVGVIGDAITPNRQEERRPFIDIAEWVGMECAVRSTSPGRDERPRTVAFGAESPLNGTIPPPAT